MNSWFVLFVVLQKVSFVVCVFLYRSGNFCSWLKFHKCKEERPLSELLGHLESAHGGSGHYAQSTLETVEFRDECPAQGSRNDRRRKIFTCWIRGRDNVNGVLEHECFPFILMITYGKRSVYWTPFIIASSKGLKDGPFKCELRFYRDCKVWSFLMKFSNYILLSPLV